jgi:hypothetical protein
MAEATGALFPGAFDDIPAVVTGQTIEASYANQNAAAINALEQVMGLNTPGSSPTVQIALASKLSRDAATEMIQTNTIFTINSF